MKMSVDDCPLLADNRHVCYRPNERSDRWFDIDYQPQEAQHARTI
jgi:hypothetical protein